MIYNRLHSTDVFSGGSRRQGIGRRRILGSSPKYQCNTSKSYLRYIKERHLDHLPIRGCSLMMSCSLGGVWTPSPPLIIENHFLADPPTPLIIENHFLADPPSPLIMEIHFFADPLTPSS